MLTALLWCGTAAIGQPVPPGMEHCEFPPQLGCPDPKGSLPGDGIPYLCRQLDAAGAVHQEACPQFVARRSCIDLLDAQVRARPYRGNCYGLLMTNCCPEAVDVDITLDPVPRSDHQPARLYVYGGGDTEAERIPAQRVRRRVLVPPGRDLAVLWVDAEEKLNIPGADLRWEVHGITAATPAH